VIREAVQLTFTTAASTSFPVHFEVGQITGSDAATHGRNSIPKARIVRIISRLDCQLMGGIALS